jgi:hypothetical protein
MIITEKYLSKFFILTAWLPTDLLKARFGYRVCLSEAILINEQHLFPYT